jgi:hypothetical protein
MNGYGYSIWLIPNNWKEVKLSYNMNHIPHITVANNLQFIDSVVLNKNDYTVENFSNVQQFPQMYLNDPLSASGFYCEIKGISTIHKPHLSLVYNKYITEIYAPPEKLMCKLYVADTRSINPSEWIFF